MTEKKAAKKVAKTGPKTDKIERLKKKVAALRTALAAKPEERDLFRTWQKRLKRAQRRKKLQETVRKRMDAKRTKKTTGETAAEAPKPEASAS
ncbi:MAG TPA: hypothetical protein VN944_11185 [Nitrospiria bacterium]|nr:hypothetical protein [Nitrospiria bacterium]